MNPSKTRKFGLLGKTLGHSFSKSFFEEKFKMEAIDARYENIELKGEEELKEWFKKSAKEYSGLNVTIPYKETVLPLMDELSKEAKEIGAINVIQFKNGKMIGHNTDTFGFQQSIKPFFRNVHEKALILGTGGASKAINYVLRNLGVSVAYLSRKESDELQVYSYEDANENMVKFHKLIVNCTPVGTFPKEDEMPNFPIHFVGEEHLVIDLIYNPSETLFLKNAREKGAVTLNGMTMLQQQALKAWEIWNS